MRIPFAKVTNCNIVASGGFITNYYCSSECRHCLYGSSPRWEKRYADPETVRHVLVKVKQLGIRSLHIGGGEPMLDREGLKKVLDVFRELHVSVEYIETNSSWYRDHDSACRFLDEVRERGVSRLLVSISPFHNEFIPFYKVEGVIRAIKDSGLDVFPWMETFTPEIRAMDTGKRHSLSEYEKLFGPGFIENIPGRYWITVRGRALRTYAPYMKKLPVEDIVRTQSACTELMDVSHFHVDLWGNYIPGLCSGFTINCDDLGRELDEEKYPFIWLLLKKGVGELYRFAKEKYGFQGRERYVSKCELCTDIRRFLVNEKRISSLELGPRQYYAEV